FEAAPQAYSVEEIPGFAQGINQAGQVVGYWAGVAFIWSPETGAVNLPSVAGASAIGLGLNNVGGAGGTLVFAGKQPVYCPAKWTLDSVEFPWGCSEATYAYGINDGGQVVGIDEQRTAIRVDTDGSIIRVGIPESVGFAINSAGQWVGRYRT